MKPLDKDNTKIIFFTLVELLVYLQMIPVVNVQRPAKASGLWMYIFKTGKPFERLVQHNHFTLYQTLWQCKLSLLNIFIIFCSSFKIIIESKILLYSVDHCKLYWIIFVYMHTHLLASKKLKSLLNNYICLLIDRNALNKIYREFFTWYRTVFPWCSVINERIYNYCKFCKMKGGNISVLVGWHFRS